MDTRYTEKTESIKSKEEREGRVVPADQERKGGMESQMEVAEKAHAIIMENLERHITIAELSQMLHASPTQIKSCFYKVYGLPIYTYARSQRMAAASKLLSGTDESILEIAGKFSYENGSKFARAFRNVMGVSPSEYRRRILWEGENGADLEDD